MTALEELYDMTYENNIYVADAHFSNSKKAACISGNCKIIVLDKPAITSQSEERELLSEEIGHYETDALYLIEATANSPGARSNRLKCEAHARQWAYKKLVPPEKT